MNSNILTCKQVTFYSPKDEDAFFEWIKKIDCIDEFTAAHDELYLHIACCDLHDQDLRELIALLYRYKIDMTQLAVFLNDSNRSWFYDNKISFWHEKVFGAKKASS